MENKLSPVLFTALSSMIEEKQIRNVINLQHFKFNSAAASVPYNAQQSVERHPDFPFQNKLIFQNECFYYSISMQLSLKLIPNAFIVSPVYCLHRHFKQIDSFILSEGKRHLLQPW